MDTQAEDRFGWRRSLGLRAAVSIIVLGVAASAPPALAAPDGEFGQGDLADRGASGSATGDGAAISVGRTGGNGHPGSGAPAATRHRAAPADPITCRFFLPRADTTTLSIGNETTDLEPGLRVYRICYRNGIAVTQPAYITIPAAGPVALPDPAAILPDLIDQAADQLTIPTPTPQLNPPGQTLPNLTTWLDAPVPASTLSATAAIPGVTATATATLRSTHFTINPAPNGPASRDDATTITCPGHGTPYRPNTTPNRSTCAHRFTTPTRDLTVTVTTVWHLTWTSNIDPGGDLGTVTATATAPYRVQELATTIRPH